MPRLTFPITALLLLLSSPCLLAENVGLQQKRATTTNTHAKQYDSQSAQTKQRSRKCGIYSGICPMSRTAKVGDYCVCHTPSGPIHGVVVP
jgi:hypothetical protein